MGGTIYVRDVDDAVLERLKAEAKAAGKSLSAHVREILSERAATPKPKRLAGTLAEAFADVGEPLDGWGPMSEDELALWEGSESFDPYRD